jgi:O-antigen/teichoic acid export membrane protein
MDLQTLGRAVRRGVWTATAFHLASQIVSLATLAVLYRQITPDDFGVFAMALVAINLARVIAPWGLGVASIQAQELTDAQQSVLCHDGLRFAAWTALALALLSKLIAWCFGEPRVFDVLVSLLLVLVAAAAGAQHQARLERRLQFGRLAVCRFIAQVIGSLVAIFSALQGLGVWALVIQQLTETTSLAGLLWIVEPWRPFSYSANRESTVHLRRFGGYYTLSGLMFWIAQNFDTILVGRLGGDHLLGLYSQAFNLMMKPVLLTTTAITGIMLPTLSRAVSSPSDYKKLLTGFYRFVGLILLPSSIGLFLLADDVMLLLGGDQWREAGVLLRALAPVIAAQGFINIAGSAFASAGRADRLLAGSAAIALLLCQGIAAGWWLGAHFGPADLGGPLGVAIAYSAVTVGVILVPYLWFCLKTVGVPMREVLTALLKPAIASLVMGAIVWATWSIAAAMIGSTPIARLIVGVVTGVTVYGIIMRHELILIRSVSEETPG